MCLTRRINITVEIRRLYIYFNKRERERKRENLCFFQNSCLFRRLNSTVGRLAKLSSLLGSARGIAFEIVCDIYIYTYCAFKSPNDSISKIVSRYFVEMEVGVTCFSSSILSLFFSLNMCSCTLFLFLYYRDIFILVLFLKHNTCPSCPSKCI